jgi:hypothetical protein
VYLYTSRQFNILFVSRRSIVELPGWQFLNSWRACELVREARSKCGSRQRVLVSIEPAFQVSSPLKEILDFILGLGGCNSFDHLVGNCGVSSCSRSGHLLLLFHSTVRHSYLQGYYFVMFFRCHMGFRSDSTVKRRVLSDRVCVFFCSCLALQLIWDDRGRSLVKNGNIGRIIFHKCLNMKAKIHGGVKALHSEAPPFNMFG